MLRWIKGVLAAGMIALVAACGGGEENRPDIASLAQQNPELSVLAEAVAAAGLAPTLAGPGPYTVFAPTNAAFADLLQRFGSEDSLGTAAAPLFGAACYAAGTVAALVDRHAAGAGPEHNSERQ